MARKQGLTPVYPSWPLLLPPRHPEIIPRRQEGQGRGSRPQSVEATSGGHIALCRDREVVSHTPGPHSEVLRAHGLELCSVLGDSLTPPGLSFPIGAGRGWVSCSLSSLMALRLGGSLGPHRWAESPSLLTPPQEVAFGVARFLLFPGGHPGTGSSLCLSDLSIPQSLTPGPVFQEAFLLIPTLNLVENRPVDRSLLPSNCLSQHKVPGRSASGAGALKSPGPHRK